MTPKLQKQMVRALRTLVEEERVFRTLGGPSAEAWREARAVLKVLGVITHDT